LNAAGFSEINMGEIKTTLYRASARREGTGIRFLLRDTSEQTVAEGTGSTVADAQRDALDKTVNDGARMHLQQMEYPESLTD
jgi:hypothetical protein